MHSTLDRPTAYAMGKRRKIMTKKLTRRTTIASVWAVILVLLLYKNALDVVVQCLDLEDDHGDTGQRHGKYIQKRLSQGIET